MNKRLRLFLALFILAVSVYLLVWGYMPNPHETRVQSIAPAEMQLP
jgi:hypothetical protein